MAKKLCLLRDVVKKFSRQDLYGSKVMNLQGCLPIKNLWVHFSTGMLTSRRCSRLLVKGFMWTRMAKKLCLLRDVVKKFSRQYLYGSKVKKQEEKRFLHYISPF